MKIVFFGSPAFAVPSLEALVDRGHEIGLVVSQPAKPVGRKKLLTDPPVAVRARELGLVRFQPGTLRNDEVVGFLAASGADLFVVVAYGKILPANVLALPRLGAVNVHGSVLPRWRGASPVQAALLAGDAETGVSLMKMDVGMDTGPVYASVPAVIAPGEDAETLALRLSKLGAKLLVDSIHALADGTSVPVSQDDAQATSCPKIKREDGRIDWTLDALELERRARAFTPWPGLFAERQGIRVKLAGVTLVSKDASGAPAGTVIAAGESVQWACGAGVLSAQVLQADGRRALPALEFVRGERVSVGEVWT
ncbi:MAG: methionyl-tRNA formyltransferase [Thermoanaerobaculia bacterium]